MYIYQYTALTAALAALTLTATALTVYFFGAARRLDQIFFWRLRADPRHR